MLEIISKIDDKKIQGTKNGKYFQVPKNLNSLIIINYLTSECHSSLIRFVIIMDFLFSNL